ncbi:hypothetical protein J6590_075101 [Homalodisca vitripennis]|nr:hypothetical protein J6590_075101 [Homalodisca vitripennis]
MRTVLGIFLTAKVVPRLQVEMEVNISHHRGTSFAKIPERRCTLPADGFLFVNNWKALSKGSSRWPGRIYGVYTALESRPKVALEQRWMHSACEEEFEKASEGRNKSDKDISTKHNLTLESEIRVCENDNGGIMRNLKSLSTGMFTPDRRDLGTGPASVLGEAGYPSRAGTARRRHTRRLEVMKSLPISHS